MANCGSGSGSMTNSYQSFSTLSDSAQSTHHSRLPSSSSSLSSSPSRMDPMEWFNTPLHKRKTSNRSLLPYVAEHPAERNEQLEVLPLSRSFEQTRQWVQPPFGRYSFAADERRSSVGSWEFDDEYDFDFPRHLPVKKRRSSVNSLAQKFLPRLPSFSKRTRENRTQSLRKSSRQCFSPGISSSRSSSRATSFRGKSTELVAVESPLPRQSFQFETINEDVAIGVESLEDVNQEEGANAIAGPDEIERKPTPLLPAVNTEIPEEAPIQSPLQSPTIAIAPRTVSMFDSPAITPVTSAIHSPALSKQPSTASFMRTSQQITDTSINPHMRSPSHESHNDEWAELLGHADYSIFPEPYAPECYTLEAHKQLHSDWERARAEFAKHLAKTGTHFGKASTTYKLTKEKWASIDAEWKNHSDQLLSLLVDHGEIAPGHTPVEPAPVAKIPTFDDPTSEGKFPKLGDEDIIGPMTVVPKCHQLNTEPEPEKQKRRISTKAAFWQFFNVFPFSKNAANKRAPVIATK